MTIGIAVDLIDPGLQLGIVDRIAGMEAHGIAILRFVEPAIALDAELAEMALDHHDLDHAVGHVLLGDRDADERPVDAAVILADGGAQ